jgi:hypothetical protein
MTLPKTPTAASLEVISELQASPQQGYTVSHGGSVCWLVAFRGPTVSLIAPLQTNNAEHALILTRLCQPDPEDLRSNPSTAVQKSGRQRSPNGKVFSTTALKSLRMKP